jgi:hypothetical protein
MFQNTYPSFVLWAMFLTSMTNVNFIVAYPVPYYFLLVTLMGWYRTKRPMQLQPFSDLLCSPSEL